MAIRLLKMTCNIKTTLAVTRYVINRIVKHQLACFFALTKSLPVHTFLPYPYTKINRKILHGKDICSLHHKGKRASLENNLNEPTLQLHICIQIFQMTYPAKLSSLFFLPESRRCMVSRTVQINIKVFILLFLNTTNLVLWLH